MTDQGDTGIGDRLMHSRGDSRGRNRTQAVKDNLPQHGPPVELAGMRLGQGEVIGGVRLETRK